jgi:hypothetical protein
MADLLAVPDPGTQGVELGFQLFQTVTPRRPDR